MKIAVRMDDISPEMDWERFEAFKELLDRFQIKPLIGVVPDNRDENLNIGSMPGQGQGTLNGHQDFWHYIRELQKKGWVVAMHGCHHVYTTNQGGLFPLNRFSEFAGLDYETQKNLLLAGKERLAEQGIHTDIFMAPAHSYDRNTLKALRDTGFRRLTDGFGKAPYLCRGMIFYPISFRLGSSLKQKAGTTTMVIHTNTMTEEDRQRCRYYFENPGTAQWISYDEYMARKAVDRGFAAALREYWLARLKCFLVKARM